MIAFYNIIFRRSVKYIVGSNENFCYKYDIKTDSRKYVERLWTTLELLKNPAVGLWPWLRCSFYNIRTFLEQLEATQKISSSWSNLHVQGVWNDLAIEKLIERNFKIWASKVKGTRGGSHKIYLLLTRKVYTLSVLRHVFALFLGEENRMKQSRPPKCTTEWRSINVLRN